ncbi:High mobility group B protein 13 [Hirschfeldia incana]|nr:High mobility group B protein 13 [Hirschfeldia incana]
MATVADPAPAKKSRNSRKALKQKNEIVESPSLLSPAKAKETKKSYEKDLMELQAMLEKMKIEKEKTEDLLKEKDEILRKKEEELETRDVEQEKLKVELKKLQKMKEFKPTMTFAFGQSLAQTEDDKKGKKKKDCPETKRPSTPYILWCKDNWNEVKKENPDSDFKETSNILGAKWKTLSAEEKKPYEEKYKADKEAYLQVITKEKREREAMKLLEDEQKQKTAMELLDQYLHFVQEAEQDNNKKKTKKVKDPLKPKQPISAYLIYANERRAALREDNKSVIEVAKLTGEEWKNLSEEQKAPYEQMAKKNKEIYLQEMEGYKRTKEEEAMSQKKEEEELMKLHKQEALQLLKKKEKTDNIIKMKKETTKNKKKNETVDPNKPKKPASSFFLFCKDARKSLAEEHPGINNSTLTAHISLKWKELGEEEREMYNRKAAELMEAYKKEVEEYSKTKSA